MHQFLVAALCFCSWWTWVIESSAGLAVQDVLPQNATPTTFSVASMAGLCLMHITAPHMHKVLGNRNDNEILKQSWLAMIMNLLYICLATGFIIPDTDYVEKAYMYN